MKRLPSRRGDRLARLMVYTLHNATCQGRYSPNYCWACGAKRP